MTNDMENIHITICIHQYKVCDTLWNNQDRASVSMAFPHGSMPGVKLDIGNARLSDAERRAALSAKEDLFSFVKTTDFAEQLRLMIVTIG